MRAWRRRGVTTQSRRYGSGWGVTGEFCCEAGLGWERSPRGVRRGDSGGQLRQFFREIGDRLGFRFGKSRLTLTPFWSLLFWEIPTLVEMNVNPVEFGAGPRERFGEDWRGDN